MQLQESDTGGWTLTYGKLVDSCPVDLRAGVVDEGDPDPPLDALLEEEGAATALVLAVAYGRRHVVSVGAEFTDLKVGQEVDAGVRMRRAFWGEIWRACVCFAKG